MLSHQQFRVSIIVLFYCVSLGTIQAQEAGPKPQAKSPPPLSLESIFHPKKKFDYDGTLPTARWVNDSPPILTVKRKSKWMKVDLQNGDESPWEVVAKLEERLSELSGIEEKQIKPTAIRAAGTLEKSDQTILVHIGRSLAALSIDKPARWLTRDASSWQNATMDPSGKRVAYTREGDLFLLDMESGRTFRMTQDASETLLDGILDWTYQEEIYGRGNYKGFWFSPNGSWLAMLRIDTSAIEPYTITGAATDRGESLVRRYSKAGDPIPHATLFLFDLRATSTTGVPPARLIDQSTAQKERIITGVWWNNKIDQLMYCISDRKQTWRELRYVDSAFMQGTVSETKRLLREESPAWVEPPTAPTFLAGGHVIWESALPNGTNRLFLIRADGSLMLPLSPDDFDIREFSINESASAAIVVGDDTGDNMQQQAYRIDFAQAQKGTPLLTPIATDEGWHSVTASGDGTAFLDQQSSIGSPNVLSVHSIDGSFETIELGRETLNLPTAIAEPNAFHITTKDNVKLPAILYRPENASADSPCPVVIETYGGPQAPVARNRWSGTRSLYRELLAREGIAVLVLDNRSSNGRGVADTWNVRGRFGEVELKDLLSGVDWLQEQDWVNSERIALRGWSFGGFLTLYAMTHSKVFSAGIAGGSVTDWREYDSFYTERYMGLPSENVEGYETTAPVKVAANLHGHVMLIHGEVDDNVHPSGTLRMAKALQDAGIDFELMIYPGSKHSVKNPNQAWHLQKVTDRFLKQQLLH